MRLADFRKDSTLVGMAASVLQLDAVKQMLDTVKREAPHNFGTPMTGWTADDRAKWLGVIEGYNMALNNFESLGEKVEETVMPEATFEDPSKFKDE